MEYKPYPDIVWQASEALASQSQMQKFIDSTGVENYDTLFSKAARDPEWFWNAVFDFLQVRFYRDYDAVMDQSEGIEWTQWCVGGKTNVVLNCLDKHKGTAIWNKAFLHYEAESGEKKSLTYAELDARVCQLAEGLRSLGLGKGDAVGLYMPMIPEVTIAFLAIIKIGGLVVPLFSGFDAKPIITRLNDGSAKAVITVDGAPRRGKITGLKSTIDKVREKIPSLEHVIIFDHSGLDNKYYPGDHDWDELIKDQPVNSETAIMDAEDPMMLVYTSGTTGMPKGTVHTHCSFMTKNLFDLQILSDLAREDKVLWMSDMGWIVGPMEIIGVSFTGATLIMAEGVPNFPDPGRIWRLIDEYKVSWFGFTPTIARMFMNQTDEIVKQYHFSSLKVTFSTGEAWNPDAWFWFFDNICKQRVPILNYSGGTEIGSGILGCTILRPLKPCCFNTAIPGMGADILNEEGESVGNGEVGELALRSHSIGLTRGLWKSPERYLDSYWRKIPGVWIHGDWAVNDELGMWYILGRSDDTLKISGKRTGPAEIEGPLLETGKIVEAAAIGVNDELGGSVIVCVCVPKNASEDETELGQELIDAVINKMGKAYKPKQIIFVKDLPKTRTMKIMRRVVKAILLSQEPGDLSSMVNPEAIDFLVQKKLR
tara:strand:+ start:1281 stop:3236 length:1956 start_codon:yes stop_codon:yes gene_type:complete